MKLLLAGILAGFSSCSVRGQGYVAFRNVGPGLNAPVVDSGGAKVTFPYMAQLLAGPNLASLNPMGSPVSFLTGGGAGYFIGGTVTISNVPGGTPAYVQVAVWDSTLGGTTTGATLQQAQQYANPFWGITPPFSVVTASSPASPAILTGLTSIVVGCFDCSIYFAGFISQPRSQVVLTGATVTLSVEVASFPPPACQWYFNGNPIPGARYSSNQIVNVQPANAGTYWVVLSNEQWGTYVSDTATLTVGGPPSITAGPQSRTAEAGTEARFSASPAGVPSPGLQWFFNGVRLSGGTNATLALGNVGDVDAGGYNVVASNYFGSVTSAPVWLSVIAPVVHQLIPTVLVSGQVGTAVSVESMESMSGGGTWQLLSELAVTNSPQAYFDFGASPSGQRFYRTRELAGPVGHSLDCQLVPMLTLTGSVGQAVLLEGIDMVGPTNAWYPVATVTLTNSSQAYFDFSAVHRPPRLWRFGP